MTPAIAAATAALAASLAQPVAPAETDVPFVTTPDNVTLAMLRLADVGPGDRLIDLGSGDGRIVITAARRFGARALGVEIVPELVRRSRDAARRAGVGERARFREQDLFAADLSPASVVTMYLLPEVNLQIRPSLLALKPGTRVVSHDWDMGDWRPDRTVTVDAPDKPIGREKLSRVHLWIVPAQVDGPWCGLDAKRTMRLRFAQRYQHFQATLHGPEWVTFDGRIDGVMLRAAMDLAFELRGPRLHVVRSRGVPALAGAAFERAQGESCG